MDVSQDGGEEAEPQREAPLVLGPQPDEHAPVGEWFVERSRYIPLRLTLIERKYLRLLEAALTVRCACQLLCSPLHHANYVFSANIPTKSTS